MCGRLGIVAALCLLLLNAGTVAFAQLPLLDTLSHDPTDPDAYGELPWASITDYPSPCVSNYMIRGIEPSTDQFDCAHVVDWPATGSAVDGYCIKYDAASGGTRWESCGTGDSIVIFNNDYCYLDGQLLFYAGS